MDVLASAYAFCAICFLFMAIIIIIRKLNRTTTQSVTYQPRTVLTPVLTAPAPPQIVVSHPGSPYYAHSGHPTTIHSTSQPTVIHSPFPQQTYNVNIPSQPGPSGHYAY